MNQRDNLGSRPNRHQRGSIFVEMMAIVPLFILLWIGLWWFHDLHAANLRGQAKARSCAWRAAMSQCKGAPPADCRIEHNGWVPAGEFHGVSQGALLNMMRYLPFLSVKTKKLQYPHGRRITVRNQETVNRPSIFGGGSSTLKQNMTVMCDAQTKDWELHPVWVATCVYLIREPVWCL